MDDPMTNPSGSKPASPRRTYSETDRSELNTPSSTAPAVCASLVLAASGSQGAAAGWLENNGIGLLLRNGQLPRYRQRAEGRSGRRAARLVQLGWIWPLGGSRVPSWRLPSWPTGTRARPLSGAVS